MKFVSTNIDLGAQIHSTAGQLFRFYFILAQKLDSIGLITGNLYFIHSFDITILLILKKLPFPWISTLEAPIPIDYINADVTMICTS